MKFDCSWFYSVLCDGGWWNWETKCIILEEKVISGCDGDWTWNELFELMIRKGNKSFHSF
jgi:hypothetical protein